MWIDFSTFLIRVLMNNIVGRLITGKRVLWEIFMLSKKCDYDMRYKSCVRNVTIEKVMGLFWKFLSPFLSFSSLTAKCHSSLSLLITTLNCVMINFFNTLNLGIIFEAFSSQMRIVFFAAQFNAIEMRL